MRKFWFWVWRRGALVTLQQEKKIQEKVANCIQNNLTFFFSYLPPYWNTKNMSDKAFTFSGRNLFFFWRICLFSASNIQVALAVFFLSRPIYMFTENKQTSIPKNTKCFGFFSDPWLSIFNLFFFKTVFNFHDNGLTGTFPPEINNLTNLETFNIGYNKLEGTLPKLSKLIKLKDFSVGANSFHGELPDFSNELFYSSI